MKARARGKQGDIAYVKGKETVITCPECGQAPVVYNGNYFCDNWTFPFSSADGECDWALAHPAVSQRDRRVCDLLGTDYE